MLHWYMPSKYGLPEFQLEQYYEMQAERFKKREGKAWVGTFKASADRVQANREVLVKWLEANEKNARQDLVNDLKTMLELTDMNRESVGVEDRVVKQALLPTSQRRVHREVYVHGSRRGLFVNRRHRFVDPLFRRRRYKWMERFLAGMHSAKEIKYNRHFTRHPDVQKKWPSNLGSVTVNWPNRRN
jgi:hypothetical protein